MSNIYTTSSEIDGSKSLMYKLEAEKYKPQIEENRLEEINKEIKNIGERAIRYGANNYRQALEQSEEINEREKSSNLKPSTIKNYEKLQATAITKEVIKNKIVNGIVFYHCTDEMNLIRDMLNTTKEQSTVEISTNFKDYVIYFPDDKKVLLSQLKEERKKNI